MKKPEFSFISFEYTEQTRDNGEMKDVCYLWELSCLREFLEIADPWWMYAKRHQEVYCCVVLDMTKLEDAFNSAIFYLTYHVPSSFLLAKHTRLEKTTFILVF